MLFDVCVSMRPDVDKRTKTSLMKAAEDAVLQYGNPPDDDDLPMLMAQEGSIAWDPEHAPARLLHKLFPEGRELADKFLYAYTCNTTL